MSSNDYHFITHWQVQGTTEDVVNVLKDATDLPRWWPSVYLKVRELERGDPQTGVGKVVDLYTKGWLPYTLRWQFRVTETTDTQLTLEATGDFVGRGVWTLKPEGDWTTITYDWKVRADKPLLRRFSALFKPIFAANHQWAMEQGEESLRLELARRRATTDAERARVPSPPARTFSLGVKR